MALPEGIETCTVTSGVPVTFGGAAVKAFVSVEPSVYLVHTATGTPLVDFLEEQSVTEGVAAQFTLPVDQDGFQDENGNAYRGWFYTARITYSTTSKAKNKTPKVKVFQLVAGQTLVDLDTLPGGVAALPYTAPLPGVSSVNGQTGAVTVATELPARLEEAALNATFAPSRATPIGNKWVTLGDSNTAGYITGAAADRWPNYLSLISRGRFQLLNNAGVGGNTSAQARARISTAVTPYAPNGCTVMVGTNDIITGVSIATWQTNVRGIVADLRAAGIAPVLCTLVPMSNSQKAGAVAEVQTWNAWLHRYAAEQSIPLLDFYSILADPITGDWKTGYSSDGVHGLSVPIVNMGRYAAKVLEPYMPPVLLPISQSNGDTANLQPNPMFVDSNADGFPDSWTKLAAGGTGTIAYTMVDDVDIRGRWSQVSATGYSLNAGWGTYQSAKISTWSIGDKIAIACYLQVPSIAPGGSYYLYASGFQPESVLIKNLTQPLPETCMYYQETTLTSTTANLGFDANVRGGTGVMRIAQPTVYNLTKMGIA